MRKKLINGTVLILALTLVMGNIFSLTYSFGEINKETKAIITDCKPDKVLDLQVISQGGTCIKIQWSGVKCADGYRIYRSTMKNGIYKKVDEVCGKTTCYIDTDLDYGTNYYYKVRAFRKSGDKICLGCASDILDVSTCPEKVKCVHANCISNSSVELNWETVYKSSGYEVYRGACENGNYVRVATLVDNGKSCFRDTNLKNNKKYYYKVRAFKELNGQVCFGECSDILCICTKK